MTREEFAKVKFKYCGHIAMEGEYQSSYVNEQYGFSVVVVTKRTCDGFARGRSHKWYNYKGKWYGWFKQFIEAIKDVEYKEF